MNALPLSFLVSQMECPLPLGPRASFISGQFRQALGQKGPPPPPQAGPPGLRGMPWPGALKPQSLPQPPGSLDNAEQVSTSTGGSCDCYWGGRAVQPCSKSSPSRAFPSAWRFCTANLTQASLNFRAEGTVLPFAQMETATPGEARCLLSFSLQTLSGLRFEPRSPDPT